MDVCLQYPARRPQETRQGSMVRRLKKSINISDLKVEVVSLSHWFVNAISTERYRSKNGRTFLVGDAAHRIPLWGRSWNQHCLSQSRPTQARLGLLPNLYPFFLIAGC